MKKGLAILVCLFALTTLVPDRSFAQIGIMNMVKWGGSVHLSDMEGTWYHYRYYNHGYRIFTVNNLGTVTSGAEYKEAGQLDTITNGQFNSAGEVTGSFDWTSGNHTFLHTLRMDARKEFLTSMAQESSSLGYMVALKGGGVFATADLQGTWYFQGINSAGASFSGWGTVNNAGGVTDGVLVYTSGASAGLIGGNISSNADGVLNGTISDSTGDTLNLFHGKMNTNKSFILCVLKSANTGAYVHLQATKYGGAFTNGDLTGDWDAFLVSEGIGPAHGTFSFDVSGNMTWGSVYSLALGMNIGLEGGPILDNDGVIGGSFSEMQVLATVDGSENHASLQTASEKSAEMAVLAYPHGKMDMNKEFMGMVLSFPAPAPAPVNPGSGGGGGGGGCFISNPTD